jgi:hypothetical protein
MLECDETSNAYIDESKSKIPGAEIIILFLVPLFFEKYQYKAMEQIGIIVNSHISSSTDN